VEKEKEIASEEKDKPVLDEQTLGKLLEAAYVLQEHNRELQEMELGLSLKREQIEAEERSAPGAPGPAPRAAEPESAASAARPEAALTLPWAAAFSSQPRATATSRTPFKPFK